ncbi:heme-binding protein [Acetobacter sp. AN02]|uniref:GlcG/HbpS family heme-binding protein n=1 Tax=Acetobacter sp. AN02 TaxID=2894186 RepID=UPI0024345FD5|nr:heme-binding protein [Acetobacter sp. AN02]MDG6095580.1 heme-binding protein [Acetobacter sp. AN02]
MSKRRSTGAILSLLIAATGLTGFASAKDLTVNLTTSNILIEQAKKLAAASHNCVAIAIVDAGGNLVSFQKMDGTQLGSIELAIRKAKTALSFARPTADMEHALNSGNYMISTLPNALPAGGGYPIMVNNELVGALGLSGGEGDTDAHLAQSTVTTFLQASKAKSTE